MSKALYTLFACLLIAIIAPAQQKAGEGKPQTNRQSGNKDIQRPVPGYDLGKYLAENIQYPERAMDKNREGRVVVKFVVNEDGSISDCQIVKGINKECDKEALRVISNMPPWKPGMKDGKPVKVMFQQPVVFRLP